MVGAGLGMIGGAAAGQLASRVVPRILCSSSTTVACAGFAAPTGNRLGRDIGELGGHIAQKSAKLGVRFRDYWRKEVTTDDPFNGV